MPNKFNNAAECWKEILSDYSSKRGLLKDIEIFARENTDPTHIVFGTSGWRGETGSDFTFQNLRVVAAAIIEVMKAQNKEVMAAMGVKNFAEMSERGVIVGHDSRFLGREFAMEVIGALQDAGIRTWYAGEATTPEFSAGVLMMNAACSINLTPSHNPANYSGFKFNPSDGGPAGEEITSKIEEAANSIMLSGAKPVSVPPKNIESIDLTDIYIKFLEQRATLDLGKIRDFVHKQDCLVCVDNVHGASRGRIERIIGETSKIVYLRTEDDFLFGGVAPEPSEANMTDVMRVLQSGSARFRIGAIMDPDGDRIRHADHTIQIPMNYFGAMALHFLHTRKGINGLAVKSVGTSNFVNAIAESHGLDIVETKVGFKNFRPYLLPDSSKKAIIAFEESDGISAYNHTPEKDALFGLLCAIEMVADTGKNLGTYLNDLMDRYGHYHTDRAGISVDRSFAGEQLLNKLAWIKEEYKVGNTVMIGEHQRTIVDAITVDGTKLVLDDGSWFMIRPSGTEPKVRFYIEARTEGAKDAIMQAAKKMTDEALKR
ncbi:MAG: phosphomannomutase [Dissulfurispiraceae bacterium]|nr:phosphomannomutase [Dissulfurispiraceae bacterium]